MPRGSISLSVRSGTPENYCTESILFNVVEVNLPFNTILGRSAMYKFMDVAHYGYLVMKMPLSNGIIKIRGDHTVGVSALEKLQALVAAHEGAARPGDEDTAPSSSRQRGSTSTPRV
jgi:hypothetical protein